MDPIRSDQLRYESSLVEFDLASFFWRENTFIVYLFHRLFIIIFAASLAWCLLGRSGTSVHLTSQTAF